MSKAELPIPERLSQWGTRTEIIYCCPNCDISFAIFGCKEKFCHNCGTKINWNVPIMVTAEFASEYHNSDWDKQKEMIQTIRNAITTPGNNNIVPKKRFPCRQINGDRE